MHFFLHSMAAGVSIALGTFAFLVARQFTWV